MVELGSRAATERAVAVTLRLTVWRVRILSRQLHVQFERRTVASAQARHLRPDSVEALVMRAERRGSVIPLTNVTNLRCRDE
jgi:hypothetical protein